MCYNIFIFNLGLSTKEIKDYPKDIVINELKNYTKKNILDYKLDLKNNEIAIMVETTKNTKRNVLMCKINRVINYLINMKTLQYHNISISDSVFKKAKEKVLEDFKDTFYKKNSLLWPRDKYAIINIMISDGYLW